jgi:hypothetical protein
MDRDFPAPNVVDLTVDDVVISLKMNPDNLMLTEDRPKKQMNIGQCTGSGAPLAQ